VLVGFSTADDAGVVRLTDEIALVQTVDFFTPIVDDPYDFGRIAATNALSDVYAMGGEPLSALNLVAFPLEKLGAEVLGDILRGGQDVANAAGLRDRRRALDRRRRAQVRPRGHRHRPPRRDPHERRRARRATSSS
jgi:selenophosphate synthase